MEEIYSSVKAECSAQIKVEGSRFIADLFPAAHEEEAEAKLDSVRKKYFDATHHCYAYIIGAERARQRYSDDGEPSGTAGVKIISALQAKNLSDTLLVVTRYFGGTKLGVGGLGRAYFEAAEHGIAAATIMTKALVQKVHIAFPFSETNPVMNIIHSRKLKIASTHYTEDQTQITLHLLPSNVSVVLQLMTDATRGIAKFTLGSSTTVVWP
ncbi:MAG: YigZ family protein [Bacteroidota bacterium]